MSNTNQLLDEALRLRESRDGQRYRCWHSELRKAWSLGFENKALEKELADVTKEFKRRLSGKPTIVTKLTVSGSAGAGVGGHVGIAEAHARVNVRAKSRSFNVAIPDKI